MLGSMLVSAERLIHSLYEDWLAAVGSQRVLDVAEALLARDFVYTDPGIVLLGRDVFLNALRELDDVNGVERFCVTIRHLGGQAVATGTCSVVRREQVGLRPYTFSALWRRAGGDWLCVAQRGAPALLSDSPVGR